MNLLRRINRGGGIPGDGGIISNYSRREVANNIAGVRILMNRMLAGMLIDDWSYRKNGVTIKNVSWGMPQSHKFVPAISWTLANRSTATPVQDILLWRKTLETDLIFSETFDTLIGSSTMFNNIIATDDFRNAARPFTPYANDTTTFQQIKLNNKLAGELFTTITGVRFDFDNAAFADELNDGSTKTERYLAENVGAFVNSADFDNGTYDFANTIVNETQVGDLAGTTIIGGGFPAPQSGPVAYATITPDLNPPNIRLWAVARGFPRKHRKTAGARVTAW
jgi:hypothetical protein